MQMKHTIKKHHAAHLKQGINFLIAVKAQIKLHTGGCGSFYARIKNAAYYQKDPTQYVHDNMFHLSMIKDHAQY